MRSQTVLALAASLSVATATYQGFNYASTKPDGSMMELDDWKQAFKAQKELDGTDGKFTSARLYTMIRDAKSDSAEPIWAIQAASEMPEMSLLLGLWCSGGQASVDKEIASLRKAIEEFPDLGSQIAGISVGSEDLYRNSKIANKTNAENPDKPLGPGVFPDVMLSYVNQVIGNLSGSWKGLPIGHVDTWTAFTNDDGSFDQGDLDAFITRLDFLGADSYPYFQGTMPNDISDSTDLFNEAFQKVMSVAGNAEVWITETGWPFSGNTINLAEASVDNAQTYWQGVGCANFGKIHTWWYTFYDDHEDPSFGVVKSLSGGATTWNLNCDGHTDSPDASQAKNNHELSSNSTSTSNSTSSSTSGSSTSSSGSGSATSGSSNSNGKNGSSSAAVMATFSGLAVMVSAFVAIAAAL